MPRPSDRWLSVDNKPTILGTAPIDKASGRAASCRFLREYLCAHDVAPSV